MQIGIFSSKWQNIFLEPLSTGYKICSSFIPAPFGAKSLNAISSTFTTPYACNCKGIGNIRRKAHTLNHALYSYHCNVYLFQIVTDSMTYFVHYFRFSQRWIQKFISSCIYRLEGSRKLTFRKNISPLISRLKSK
jgi:hypothetical protein